MRDASHARWSVVRLIHLHFVVYQLLPGSLSSGFVGVPALMRRTPPAVGGRSRMRGVPNSRCPITRAGIYPRSRSQRCIAKVLFLAPAGRQPACAQRPPPAQNPLRKLLFLNVGNYYAIHCCGHADAIPSIFSFGSSVSMSCRPMPCTDQHHVSFAVRALVAPSLAEKSVTSSCGGGHEQTPAGTQVWSSGNPGRLHPTPQRCH